MRTKIFLSWSERPKSRAGYLRSKKLERRQIKKWKNVLRSSYNVQLEIIEPGYLLNGSDLYQYMVDNGKRAAFSRATKTVYMRKGFTYFEIAHEANHAKHWHEIGAVQYSLLDELEKEMYVYNELVKDKNLKNTEIADAKLYINRLRQKFNYPSLP